MGDRANVQFIEASGGTIYFYTHWDGYKLPETLANALDRSEDRWNDDPYLARIIFSEMIKDYVLDTTGYGISTYRTDENYPDLIVDSGAATVTDRDGMVYSFQEYIEKYKE